MEQKQVNSSMTDSLNPSRFFRHRNLILRLSGGALLLASILGAIYIDFLPEKVFTCIPRVIVWIFSNLIPDAKAWSNIPKITSRMVDTVLMALMATTTASLVSLGFSLLAARATRVNLFLETFSRTLASVCRNVPVVAWALIFLITFGMSTFTGFLAILFSSFGFLTRAFSETIDQSAGCQVEALRASGATYWHIIAQAVLPASLPKMISWILYVIETNIRDATLVGLLTGSGIGFLFDLYYKSQQYKSASLLVLFLVAVVIGIEQLSNTLRRKIL